MKKKILLTINVLILILLLPLVGCNKKHTHTYEDTYSYDDAGHWYKSTCKHDLKKDYGTHTFEVSIISPTYDELGYTLHKCSVCGYSYKDTYTDALLKTYNITYNLDGGTNNLSNPSTYTIEDPNIELESPTKEGYEFLGWVYNEETVAVIDTSIASDITLEAIWEPITYTITYNLNGGTNNPNNPTSYTIESGDITLENPTKTGYTFTGWTNDEITTPNKDITIVNGSNGNKTFTANFEGNTHTVTLDTTGYTYSGETSYNVKCGEAYKFDVVSGTAGWGYNDILVTDKNGNVSSWNIDSDVVLKPLVYGYTDSTKTTLYFGTYPQTKVNNTTTISTLNSVAGTLPTSTNTYLWTDYEYYIEGSISSYMYYIDIDEDSDGDYDYRGVYFTSYRSYKTSNPSNYTYQDDNGYSINTIYWFKYEPIKWNILKTENNKALILSDLILDSQDINYTTSDRSGATDYEGNSTTETVCANNYMYSHIRSWLNTTFYETAFTTLEKQIIEVTEVDNSASSTANISNRYVCGNTSDKIFLLSYSEVTTYYSSDNERSTSGSDYAKCQGLYVYPGNDKSTYWLRSPIDYADENNNLEYKENTGLVYYDGISTYGNYANYVSEGIRMACWINL